jgi:glycosyltransferase involved in cell wall biosynthesis
MISLLGLTGAQVTVIPNGVEKRFFESSSVAFKTRTGLENIVLCVGRIEPLKNQLNIAQAMNNTGITTVFIGDPASRGADGEEAYVCEFKSVVEQSENMHCLPGIEHTDPLLASAYATARVHVLASTAEAQGLVSCGWCQHRGERHSNTARAVWRFGTVCEAT